MICMSGTPTIIPKVTRSRESWRTSLVATALTRRNAPVNLLARKVLAPRRHDEDVLETGMGEFDFGVDRMLFQERAQLRVRVLHVPVRENPQPDTKLGDAVHPRQFPDEP